MSENRYSSIYLPKELKHQLVETAKAEGFEVGHGRRSSLVKFIQTILQEHKLTSQNDPVALSLCSLAPELRFSIVKLGEMEMTRQRLVNALLELLFASWQEQDAAQE